MYCQILGKPCIGEECKQYEERFYGCSLYRRIGEFLYQPQPFYKIGAFIDFLTEIRPEVIRGENRKGL